MSYFRGKSAVQGANSVSQLLTTVTDWGIREVSLILAVEQNDLEIISSEGLILQITELIQATHSHGSYKPLYSQQISPGKVTVCVKAFGCATRHVHGVC